MSSLTDAGVEGTCAAAGPAAGSGDPGRVASGGRIVLVTNVGDDVGAAAHLAALGGRGDGRVVVVRPTPGAGDLGTLGLDVLVAAGKRPGAAKAARVTAMSWEIARAWMRAGQVGDVVVDRAHRLTERQAAAIAEFAAGVGASLWLVWGGRENPAHLHDVSRARHGQRRALRVAENQRVCALVDRVLADLLAFMNELKVGLSAGPLVAPTHDISCAALDIRTQVSAASRSMTTARRPRETTISPASLSRAIARCAVASEME